MAPAARGSMPGTRPRGTHAAPTRGPPRAEPPQRSGGLPGWLFCYGLLFEIHHTPKHGSWLNMAEIELSALARDLPERVGDRPTLERHMAAWERRRNDAGVAADWRFTTADARIRLRKLYPTVEA